MRIIKLIFRTVVLVVLFSSCEEVYYPYEENVVLDDPFFQYNPNLPNAIFFETPGTVFTIGQTVIGWDNKIDVSNPGEANNDGREGSGINPNRDQDEFLRLPNSNLRLYQNGVYQRTLSSAEVQLSLERIDMGNDPDAFVEWFEWTIPAHQATGTGFQLRYEPYHSGYYTGAPSPFFDITFLDRIEIELPNPWVTNYEQGTSMPYLVYYYCSSPPSSISTKIFKGQTLIRNATISNPSFDPILNRTSLNSVINFDLPDFPIGNDYSFVVEMVCNGSTITRTEYFQVLESVGGGVPPIEILPGW